MSDLSRRSMFARVMFCSKAVGFSVASARAAPADPRFDRVDAPDTYIDTLQEVDRRVSKWTGKKPLEKQDFYLQPPELDRRIVDVRTRLRASVPEWLPKK